MWLSDSIICDRCETTITFDSKCIQIGNVIISELCSSCIDTTEREIRSKMKTKSGPPAMYKKEVQ